MATSLLPSHIHERYEVHEWKHACAVLHTDFPAGFKDIVAVLGGFTLLRSNIVKPGGRKSPVAIKLDSAFTKRGWKEKGFDTKVVIDKKAIESPTHKVDCFKNRVRVNPTVLLRRN